jgi:two-component system NtrC family response regulator
MKAAKAANPNLAVVLLTAFGSIDQAVAAMKDGADDFLTKPVDLDQLELRVEKALKAHRLEEQVEDLKAQLDEKYGLAGIVGNSPAMQKLFRLIKQAAPTDATVLLEGPSGTGKGTLGARLLEEDKSFFFSVSDFTFTNSAFLKNSRLEMFCS